MKRLVGPKYFFSGFLLALVLCSIAGYVISKKARFNHFDRFFSHISASLDYYPTASELVATAKHKVKRDKILVLIGGSSIFRGDGQNSNELWSKKLQELLGDDYRVLNYAYNGAGFGSFGGVAYRILIEYYPKIIYVTSCSNTESPDIDRNDYSSYVFWDAYYKNLFHPDKIEQKKISKLRKIHLHSSKIEMHLMSYLDSFLYFKSLWNWVSYRYLFTIWNGFAQPQAFKARRLSVEAEVNNKERAEDIKKNKFKFDFDAITAIHYSSQVDFSSRQFFSEKRATMHQAYDNAFPARYRSKILCFITRYNPSYLMPLRLDDKKAYNIMQEDTVRIVKSFGYHVVEVNNFKPDDYIDLMHYLAAGGNKVAEEVAPHIIKIAKANNYLVDN